MDEIVHEHLGHNDVIVREAAVEKFRIIANIVDQEFSSMMASFAEMGDSLDIDDPEVISMYHQKASGESAELLLKAVTLIRSISLMMGLAKGGVIIDDGEASLMAQSSTGAVAGMVHHGAATWRIHS